MRLGITLLSTCRSMAPAQLAREVEDRGIRLALVRRALAHPREPPARRFPGASPKRPELPDVYWHLNDGIVSMAMAAAVTTDLTIGSSVTLVAQHDPIWLAKELATIDHHSGGRLEVGVGFGWNREEYEAHGHDWTRRRDRTADCLADHAIALDRRRGEPRRRPRSRSSPRGRGPNTVRNRADRTGTPRRRTRTEERSPRPQRGPTVGCRS